MASKNTLVSTGIWVLNRIKSATIWRAKKRLNNSFMLIFKKTEQTISIATMDEATTTIFREVSTTVSKLKPFDNCLGTETLFPQSLMLIGKLDYYVTIFDWLNLTHIMSFYPSCEICSGWSKFIWILISFGVNLSNFRLNLRWIGSSLIWMKVISIKLFKSKRVVSSSLNCGTLISLLKLTTRLPGCRHLSLLLNR